MPSHKFNLIPTGSTDKSIWFTLDDGDAFYLPLSKITIAGEPVEGTPIEVEVPEWLVQANKQLADAANVEFKPPESKASSKSAKKPMIPECVLYEKTNANGDTYFSGRHTFTTNYLLYLDEAATAENVRKGYGRVWRLYIAERDPEYASKPKSPPSRTKPRTDIPIKPESQNTASWEKKGDSLEGLFGDGNEGEIDER